MRQRILFQFMIFMAEETRVKNNGLWQLQELILMTIWKMIGLPQNHGSSRAHSMVI